MEDSDFTSLIESCAGSPAVQRFLSTLTDAVSARGGDMDIGSKHESILKSLEAFEDVHVETLTVPLNGSSPSEYLVHQNFLSPEHTECVRRCRGE